MSKKLDNKPTQKKSIGSKYDISGKDLRALMSPEKRALAEKIDAIRKGFGDGYFNVTGTIRKIRNAER